MRDDDDDDRLIIDRQIIDKEGKLFLMTENQLINIDRVTALENKFQFVNHGNKN